MVAGCLCLHLFAESVSGADPVPAPAEPQETIPVPSERTAMATAGVVLFSLVIVLAVGLLAAVLLLGARTRRLARQSLPESCVRDEHWFLRHRKPEDTASGEGGSKPDETTAKPSPGPANDAGEA